MAQSIHSEVSQRNAGLTEEDSSSNEIKKTEMESLKEKTIIRDVENQSEEEATPEGRNIEIYRQAWSKKVLIYAYTILMATAFVETFAGDSSSGLDSYATSSFNSHAMISTAGVVFKITAIISYSLLGKLADFFGRAEGFAFAILIYTLAYVLYAACQNPQTYLCAELFFAVGKVGYRIFQQIFIADTTSLLDRGMWSNLPDALAAVPSLYVGTILQDKFVEDLTWRWGYGIWAICLSCSCIPLIGVMFYLDKRAKQTGEQKILRILQHIPQGPWYRKVWYFLFNELDLFGCLLMVVGLCLCFVPLTLTGSSSSFKWHEPRLIAMLCVGFVIFMGFLAWNSSYVSSRLGKKPFVEPQALTNKTMILACVMTALELCLNSSLSTYFKTMLQVSGGYSVGEAARIDDSKKACYQIFAVVCGVAMKYTAKSKVYVLVGFPLVMLGQGLLTHFINNNGGISRTVLLYVAEVLIGMGRGIYNCALLVIVQGIAGSEGIPLSTAFFLAFQSIGSLIGSCVSGGIWNTIVLRKLNKYLPTDDKGKAKKIYKSITVALSYDVGTDTRSAINRAYRETVQIIGYAGIGILAPTLILMWFVRDIKLTKHNDIYGEDSEDEAIAEVEIEAKTKKQTAEL